VTISSIALQPSRAVRLGRSGSTISRVYMLRWRRYDRRGVRSYGLIFAIGTAAACGRIGFDPNASTDAADPVDSPTLGPWQPPTPVPGTNTNASESDPSVTSDRLTIVFTRIVAGNGDIFLGTRGTTADPFTTAAILELNTTFDEASPEISADGTEIYFISSRSGTFDVYHSTFNSTWSPPVMVPELSSLGDEGNLAVSPDGLTALVVRKTGANKVFESTRTSTALPWGSPVEVPSLEVTADVEAPTLTNQGALVLLHVGTTRDLVIAQRLPDGTYETPALITEIDTAAREAAPFIGASGRYLVFEQSSDLVETSR